MQYFISGTVEMKGGALFYCILVTLELDLRSVLLTSSEERIHASLAEELESN